MTKPIAKALIFFALLLAGSGAAAQGSGGGRHALLVEISGPIGPATTAAVEEGLAAARERGAAVVILRLDTPGGLVDATREIVSAILASPVPVIGYVAPSGAHAASAGTYILYATHLAAMAPGTNLGAATPVAIGGGEEPEQTPEEPGASAPGNAQALRAKQVNDAVAFIKSLAEMHGRNAEWAERAVREGASLTASEALAEGVAEILAHDTGELLEAADGRTVKLSGEERTLETAQLRVETFEPGFPTRLLGVLANPNIAFLLMMIGVYGLILEFSNPGSIGPGVVGAIALVLGLYALNQLPVDYAGLALLLLGVALMVAEAVTPTFGLLGIGGLVAFVLGAIMLIDTDMPAFRLDRTVIAVTAVVSGTVLIFLVGYLWRAHRRPVRAGAEHLRGARAAVLDWSGAAGHVRADGERWTARSETGAPAPGGEVEIVRVDGLTLVVRPATDGNKGGT